MRRTKTIGRIDCVGMREASDAPAAEPTNAGNAMAARTLMSGLIWRR